MNKTQIIAEIGNNHNGDYKLACKMVEGAIQAGADYAKFQLYNTSEFIHKNSIYYKEFSRERLSYEKFLKIFKKYNNKIKVIATPFDVTSARFLNSLPVSAIKIASGDIDNFMMFEEIKKKKNHIFFSSGGSSIKDIKRVLNFFKNKCKSITPFHCIASYPSSLNNVNLGYIDTLKKKLKRNIGFSDHCEGITSSCLSLIKGPLFVEKHFTIDKKLPGGDNLMSVDVDEMKEIIKFRDNLKKIFFSKKRAFSKNEKNTTKIIRRVFFVKKNIQKNQIFNEQNLAFLRINNPKDNYYSGKDYIKIKNTKAKKNLKKDMVLKK